MRRVSGLGKYPSKRFEETRHSLCLAGYRYESDGAGVFLSRLVDDRPAAVQGYSYIMLSMPVG